MHLIENVKVHERRVCEVRKNSVEIGGAWEIEYDADNRKRSWQGNSVAT